MSGYEFKALIETIDPTFRQEEERAYRALMARADESLRDDAAAAQFEGAMKVLAASIYTTAQDYNLTAVDVGIISIYLLAMLTGAACKDDGKTLEELKTLFSESLDAANANRGRSAELMAEMVGDGLTLMEHQKKV